MSHNRTFGFTLIEVLVALVVFAILATITASTMYYAFNTRERVNAEANRLLDLQLALTLMERDALHAIARPVRGNEMHLFPAFSGQNQSLEFTRGGIANPNGLTLQRVAWLCAGHQLLRRSFESLDTTNRNQYQDRVLLDNLSRCQFHYLTNTLQILSEWHDNVSAELPSAIQVSLAYSDWGEASFLFPLPKALYATPTV